MKALITGMSGFVGQYLYTELLRCGYTVAGTCLPNDNHADNGIYYKMNILNEEDIEKVLTDFCPDEVYHLAGQSSVALSWDKPKLTIDINVNGTINLLNAVKKIVPKAKVLIVGSSDEYGIVKPDECPVNEYHVLNPVSPYGISKMTQEKVAEIFAKAYNLNIIMVRPFNHIGAGQGRGFVVSDFAARIAALEKVSDKAVIKVGNLHSYRDFTAVEDVVRAYVKLLQHGKIGEVYNVGSGEAIEIQEILKTLLNYSKKDIRIVEDIALYRPIDVPIVKCDNSKLKKDTGWVVQKNVKEALLDVLNYWRNKEGSKL